MEIMNGSSPVNSPSGPEKYQRVAMMKIALYLRLSAEDNMVMDESNSITNQRILLKEFLHGKTEFSTCEIKEYCDDGYSGANFDRPGITKLLDDVKRNLIDCIVVKDFSRFSRDYIEMGAYLDQIFPFMGVRFISVNDHYDSLTHKGTTTQIDTAFKTLLNDFYSKDISAKVKTAIQSKCSNGEYAFGQFPFGYEKSPVGKNQIKINEKEAEIVRYIFQLSAGGMSPVAIEKRLHGENIPTCQELRGKAAENPDRVCCWSSASVRSILNNRFYLGEFIYNKTQTAAVGSKKKQLRPKAEWTIQTDHHEPLVTEELFIKAAYKKCDNSAKRKKPKHPLIGKLYCGGCGYAMIYKAQRSESGRIYRRFECRKHALLQIDSCCTYYNAAVLEELVLTMVTKELLKQADLQQSRDAVKDSLKGRIGLLEEKLKSAKQKQAEWEQETYTLYEAYSERKISAAEYMEKRGRVEKQLKKQEAAISRYQRDLSVTESAYLDNCENLKQVLKYSQLSELTQEVVDDFIHRVKVYRDKAVEIEWGFSVEEK